MLTYWCGEYGVDQIEPGDREFALVICSSCAALSFGPPNDEALQGHRLYDLGLTAYTAQEVVNSRWIAAQEEANRVHRSHSAELFRPHRHFIITFHDSTFEFVARDFTWTRQKGSPAEAARAAFQELK